MIVDADQSVDAWIVAVPDRTPAAGYYRPFRRLRDILLMTQINQPAARVGGLTLPCSNVTV